MKVKTDPRHQKRVTRMKQLFSATFRQSDKSADIDALITECAPEWPLSQMNKIDLSVLRLAIHELQTKDTPQKVVIDEAVELAKEYGSDKSAKFVNGVLGAALEKINNAKPTND